MESDQTLLSLKVHRRRALRLVHSNDAIKRPAMNKLLRSDLYSLESYAEQRKEFRSKVIAHKTLRTLRLGEHVTLMFEDRLTVQYQIQEMLRIERIFEGAAIQEELDAYNPLIPDGSNFKATMLIEYSDVEQRKAELARLGGIEHCVFVQVDGFERNLAIADEDLDRSEGEKTSAVHFLRFELNKPAIMALRGGSALKVGIDDRRMPIEHTVSPEAAKALRADLH